MKNKLKILILLSTTLLSTSVFASGKMMIFGGDNNSEYLGCFNCSDISADSVHNDIGRYGSDTSSNSIFNDIGKFGSDISPYSPCNDIASNPPVLVDQNGGFYGYLTLNDIKPRAITDSSIVNWLKYKVCS